MQESKQNNRGIDNDHFLLNSVKNFYDKSHDEKIFRWHLEQNGYTKEEIDGAIADYHWIYIYSPTLVNNILIPFSFICIVILSIMFFISGVLI